MLKFEYFYGYEADDFTFYRIPKKIITEPIFKGVSYGAKILYGLLFDRVGLSIKNGWLDDENRVYIIFSISEIMESLYCSKGTAVKFMSELEDVGLIERQKRGQGYADYIYVKKFSENDGKVVQNLDFKKSKACTSKGSKDELQEVQTLDPNNTNINNTEFNNTDCIPSHHPKSRKEYEEIIKENIEYDIIKNDFKDGWLENIIEIMLDVLCSDSSTIRINNANIPIEQVRERYLLIDDMHIRYLEDAYNQNQSEVRNIRAFFITVIYNAPVMIDSFYENWVKNDMKRGLI